MSASGLGNIKYGWNVLQSFDRSHASPTLSIVASSQCFPTISIPTGSRKSASSEYSTSSGRGRTIPTGIDMLG